MTKLLVVLVGFAWFVRLRLRRNPRLRARIYPWTLAACAAMLLLATNLGPGAGRLGTAFHLAKLVCVAMILGSTLYDIRRTLGPARLAAATARGRGR